MTTLLKVARIALLMEAAFTGGLACVGSGDGLDDNGNPIYPTRIHGQITHKQLRPIGPGAMFIEWGMLWGGDFRWATTVDESGHFSRMLPTAGLESPAFGMHWYFPGYIYIAKQVYLHPGQDNDINVVLYESDDPSQLSEIPVLPTSFGGRVIFPLADDNLADNPVIANPAVTVVGRGLIKAELDAMSPKGNLSEQILVGARWGDGSDTGVKMNPPGPVVDGNYPPGHYSVTLKVPDSAPDVVPFLFIGDDHDCNNSPPMFLTARVR